MEMEQKRTVQFSSEPAKVIMPVSSSITISTTKNNLDNFSAATRSNKKRLAKLVLIFVIPVVTALAQVSDFGPFKPLCKENCSYINFTFQCGSFMSKMVTFRSMTNETVHGLSSLMNIGNLINYIQKERASVVR